jgi:hypothetical protein
MPIPASLWVRMLVGFWAGRELRPVGKVEGAREVRRRRIGYRHGLDFAQLWERVEAIVLYTRWEPVLGVHLGDRAGNACQDDDRRDAFLLR